MNPWKTFRGIWTGSHVMCVETYHQNFWHPWTSATCLDIRVGIGRCAWKWFGSSLYSTYNSAEWSRIFVRRFYHHFPVVPVIQTADVRGLLHSWKLYTRVIGFSPSCERITKHKSEHWKINLSGERFGETIASSHFLTRCEFRWTATHISGPSVSTSFYFVITEIRPDQNLLNNEYCYPFLCAWISVRSCPNF